METFEEVLELIEDEFDRCYHSFSKNEKTIFNSIYGKPLYTGSYGGDKDFIYYIGHKSSPMYTTYFDAAQKFVELGIFEKLTEQHYKWTKKGILMAALNLYKKEAYHQTKVYE